MRLRGRALLGVAGLVAALVAGPALPAHAADCVALVVDPAPGAARTGCVTWSSGLTGVDVLQRAGHTVQFRASDGLICRIDAVPGSCAADATHFWSYWHRAPGGSAWSFSNEGAATYQPARNSTEGWAYQDGGSRQPANVAFGTICPQAAPTHSTPRSTAPHPPARSSRPPTHPAPPPASATAGRPGSGGTGPTATGSPGGRPAAGTTAGSGPHRTPATATGTTGAAATGSSPPAVSSAPAVPVASTTGNAGDGSGPPVAALAGIVLVAAVAGAGLWFARNRRRTGSP
jgi:hypothetical protein